MQQILTQMLNNYEIKTLEDKKNALKEIVQEIVLAGLSRTNFFKNAAFYGGTALRIFYVLDRFSEDLDFSLITPDENFDISKYFSAIENEVKSLGLNFHIEEKVKNAESNIKSAFLKTNTKELILNFYDNSQEFNIINPREIIKIKFEIDVNPPDFATFEYKYRLLPSPYQVKLYDMPSLFAGKIHAVICRAWKSRVKGRDLYDYIFYLSQNATVNLSHLKARLVQSNFIPQDYNLTLENLKQMLIEKFSTIDFKQAKEDVQPFIKDSTKLDLWSKDFFIQITDNLK